MTTLARRTLVAKLSRAQKYAIHRAAMSGRLYCLNDDVLESTVRSLERMGLLTVVMQDYGRWTICHLTDAGKTRHTKFVCAACEGTAMITSADNDGTGVTCPTCRGMGYS